MKLLERIRGSVSIAGVAIACVLLGFTLFVGAETLTHAGVGITVIALAGALGIFLVYSGGLGFVFAAIYAFCELVLFPRLPKLKPTVDFHDKS